MALGGYYMCQDCGARRDHISPPQKMKDESGKVYDRILVEYDCGSTMIIYRYGFDWRKISFEHKCKPPGGYK